MLENAGSAGFWTGLRWSFPVKEGSVVRLIVNSRTVQIGCVSCTMDSLLKAVTDNRGVKRVSVILWVDYHSVSLLIVCYVCHRPCIRCLVAHKSQAK